MRYAQRPRQIYLLTHWSYKHMHTFRGRCKCTTIYQQTQACGKTGTKPNTQTYVNMQGYKHAGLRKKIYKSNAKAQRHANKHWAIFTNDQLTWPTPIPVDSFSPIPSNEGIIGQSSNLSHIRANVHLR